MIKPRTLAEHLDPAVGPKRMLALDGGGTLGAIEIAFLERIEALLRARAGGDPNFRLCHYFDLIGGTSTGAIIAAGLALGMSAAELKTLYFRLAPAVFKKPWLSLPGLPPRFRAKALIRELSKVISTRTLQSEDIKTGIAIVTKRLDTASAWVLTNNPNGKFWHDPPIDTVTGKRSHIGNKHYKLADIVRASTAAPYFFEPQLLSINDEEPSGLFVDGGVSPHNNPALQLLMLAGLKGHGFNWPIGSDKLLLISIGAGWRRPWVSFDDCKRMSRIGLAAKALRGVSWDGQVEVLKLLQWISEPRRPWPINSEVGGLEDELLVQGGGSGQQILRFQRYDINLDRAWIAQETGLQYSAERVLKLDNFVDPGIMKDAYEIASKAAVTQVHEDDFPASFN